MNLPMQGLAPSATQLGSIFTIGPNGVPVPMVSPPQPQGTAHGGNNAYQPELADWARYSRQGVLFRGLRVRWVCAGTVSRVAREPWRVAMDTAPCLLPSLADTCAIC